jgi:hypothetical protein
MKPSDQKEGKIESPKDVAAKKKKTRAFQEKNRKEKIRCVFFARRIYSLVILSFFFRAKSSRSFLSNGAMLIVWRSMSPQQLLHNP